MRFAIGAAVVVTVLPLAVLAQRKSSLPSKLAVMGLTFISASGVRTDTYGAATLALATVCSLVAWLVVVVEHRRAGGGPAGHRHSRN